MTLDSLKVGVSFRGRMLSKISMVILYRIARFQKSSFQFEGVASKSIQHLLSTFNCQKISRGKLETVVEAELSARLNFSNSGPMYSY